MDKQKDQFAAMLREICTAYYFSKISPEAINSYPVMKKVWELTQKYMIKHNEIAAKEQLRFNVRQIRDLIYLFYVATNENRPQEHLSTMFSLIKLEIKEKLKITLTSEEESFLQKNTYTGNYSNIKGPHEIAEIKFYELLSKHQISGFSPTSQETLTRQLDNTLKNLKENPQKELITEPESKTAFTIAVLLNLRLNGQDEDLLEGIGLLVKKASDRGLFRN